MWNKIACNRLIEEKNNLKEQKRQSSKIKQIKSTFQIKQPHRLSFVACNIKGKQNTNDKYLQIDRENQNLVTRIRSIKTMGSSTSLNRYQNTRSFSKMFKNNKQQVKKLKKKELEVENHRILKRLIHTSSSLTKLRVNTCENSLEKVRQNKTKSIMFMSGNQTAFKNKSFSKKMYTEAPIETESKITQICFDSPIKESKVGEQKESQIIEQFNGSM